MRKLFGLFTFLCFSMTLSAQSSSAALVISTAGKVEYYKDGGKGVRVAPMEKLDIRGKVKVGKDGSVKLLFENRSYKLNKSGTYEIRELVKSGEKPATHSFASRFWGFINTGIKSTDDKNALENYHQQYMEEEVGGVSGFGQRQNRQGNVMPGPGLLSRGVVTFHWSRNSAGMNGPFRFEIQEAETGEVIFFAYARDSFLSLNLDHLNVEAGKGYFWSVYAYRKSNDAEGESQIVIVCDKIPFRYHPDVDSFIQPKLALLEDYKEASAWEKKWMEAIVLENEGFYYDSEKRYLELLTADPDDTFIKIMYAAFLARQDKLDKAMRFIQ